MDRSARLVLLCLTCFLVLFPLVVDKPGLPMTLKADEAAYYLMSLSLAYDGDVRCEPRDLRRWFDEYPTPGYHHNLILMSDDGWKTSFYGKPYLYSLFTAPAARWFGANGLVASNMLLMMAMVWMGASYLGSFNSTTVATLFSAGFFLLSAGFAYVFWLHPELFNMASVTGALYLALHRFEWRPPLGRLGRAARRVFNPATLPALSGAVLALGVYNKPVLAAFALPALVAFRRRRGWRGVAAFAAGILLAGALASGGAVALTGHPSAYLGVARGGFNVTSPDHLPTAGAQVSAVAQSPTQNSWGWLARLPDNALDDLRANAGYFLWGRHTGLVPYEPFAPLAVALFLLFGVRSAERWLTLVALAVTAVFFIVWIPFNWHGGGGFIGNRYFVNAYPAFLFLVTRVPAWTTVAGYAAGGLLLGPILFTPFGAPVRAATLQAHVRNPPFELFPLELSILDRIPGYHGANYLEAHFSGRKDVFEPLADEMWVHGGHAVEVWVKSLEPLGEVLFEVRSRAPGNRVTIDFGGTREVLVFAADPPPAGEARRVAMTPHRVGERLVKDNVPVWAYRLVIDSRGGRNAPLERSGGSETFYQGAALAFLGGRLEVEADLFDAGWSLPRPPSEVVAGEPFETQVVIQNRAAAAWPANGPTRVTLSYRWLDAVGGLAVAEGRRTRLPRDLQPGQRLRLTQKVWAPDQPGDYVLVLEPVRERVAWFSQKNPAAVHRLPLRVRARADAEPQDASSAEPGSSP